jgi:hypothetical protein
MKKLMFLIVIIIFIFIGCSNNRSTSNGFVEVAPSQLFEGDTKKLEPHLNMITGCIDVKYKGDKQTLSLKYEIWENGELKQSNNSISNFISDNEFNGEISISLKDIFETSVENQSFMQMKTVISNSSGYSSSTTNIEKFDKGYGYAPIELSDVITKSDHEEIAIWGLTAYIDGHQFGGRGVEEEVQKADWGFVLKLSFE